MINLKNFTKINKSIDGRLKEHRIKYLVYCAPPSPHSTDDNVSPGYFRAYQRSESAPCADWC